MKGFNIRVYGLCINSGNQILLSDEFRLGMKMTKFPGGGLEYGEGTRECLKRELLEETGQEIIVGEHFYTTDFFQDSLSFEGYQLISIYYFFSFKNVPEFKVSQKAFDFDKLLDGAQSFRWLSLDLLTPEHLTLPVDKHVAKILLEK